MRNKEKIKEKKKKGKGHKWVRNEGPEACMARFH